MRTAFHEQIDEILADLPHMCRVVSLAVQDSTTALLNADLRKTEQVISGDLELDRLQASIEARAFNVLARQSPLAGDLRTMVTSLRMVTELERSGRAVLRRPPPRLRGASRHQADAGTG